MHYTLNGGGNDIYDHKTQNGGGVYSGSQILEGLYVSAREVVNFAAGLAAAITGQSKMDFMLTAGGFNLSDNSKMSIVSELLIGKMKHGRLVIHSLEKL